MDKIFKLWFALNEKLRLILVGGYNTSFAYIIFVLSNYFFKNSLHYLLILVISHLISVLNSFFTFRFFVFRSQKNLWQEYIKVNIVYLGYLICNSIMLFCLKEIFGINILISQLICVISLTIAVYIIHKNFSFKK